LWRLVAIKKVATKASMWQKQAFVMKIFATKTLCPCGLAWFSSLCHTSKQATLTKLATTKIGKNTRYSLPITELPEPGPKLPDPKFG
jgi:hypothetical protein